MLMHMEYCVMLNLRRSVKTKRTIHFEYRTASKKKPKPKEIRLRKKCKENLTEWQTVF